jgi:AraC-like DNA-binding protein
MMMNAAPTAIAPAPLVPGEVVLVRHPHHADVELTRLSLPPAKRYVEMRDTPVVIRIDAGSGMSQCRGALRHYTPGDLHVCRAWTTCAFVAGAGGLDLTVLAARPADGSLLPDAPRTAHLAAEMKEAIDAWDAGDDVRRDEALDHFRAALADPRGQWNEPSPPIEPGTMRRARAHLEDHLSTPVPLDELAEVSGLSKFHLARSFRAYHGVPPHLFWIHHRIARARSKLAAGEPSASVAAELGFADPSHFGRRFRQVVGISPAAYARASDSPARGRLP